MASHPRRFLPIVLLALGACGAGSSRNPFAEAYPSASQLRVYVENRGFNDVRIHSVTSRGTQSLGTVSGNGNREMRIEWRQLDQIGFRIEVLAGQTYRTESLAVSPGDRIELLIPDNPSNAILRTR